jgi:hypothetical protein
MDGMASEVSCRCGCRCQPHSQGVGARDGRKAGKGKTNTRRRRDCPLQEGHQEPLVQSTSALTMPDLRTHPRFGLQML